MKRLAIALCLSLFAGLSTARAQNPPTPAAKAPHEVNPAPTEDMWFYLQELRRYDDPQLMVRRNAEQKAAQRRLRLAAMKWFGFSPSRPVASPVPWMGVAAPTWIGNGANPYYWVGGGFVSSASLDTGRIVR